MKNAASPVFRKTPIALAVAAFAGVVGITAAAPGDPVTGEIAVNTTTSNVQAYPTVAMDADGDFVVAWGDQGENGGNYVVSARRFTADGAPLSGELAINVTTSSSRNRPTVAMDADGDFVVAWESYGQDGDNEGVFARRFAADGTPLSGELAINITTSSFQATPAVAMDAVGNFVVAWQSNLQDGSGRGVFARCFAANGAPLTGELAINTTTSDSQSFPAVAMDADGDFVVAWTSYAQNDGGDIVARRFAANCTPLSGELAVSTTTSNPQREAAVAMDADGDFVVVWRSYGQDGGGYGVFARRFAADGTPLSGELAINTATSDDQVTPTIAMGADGDFVVAWQSRAQDGSDYGVFARRFAADGAPLSGELAVNTFTSGSQRFPAVAMDADGDFVVAWQSYLQDGSQDGVFARIFEGPLTCSVEPLTCTELPAGSLSLKNSLKPGKPQFKYKGSGGDTTVAPELFGDPTADTDNVLCVYNGDGVILQLDAIAGEANSKDAPAWKLGSNGATKFSNSDGNADGVRKIQQKPGAKAKLTWSAGKLNFAIPEIPLTGFPIVVQNQITGGACTETTFDEADFSKNDAEKVKAKTK